MQIFIEIGNFINQVMGIFGAAIVVPIVILIISLVMRVQFKKAIQGALYMAVGLTLFSAILGILFGGIAPFVTAMATSTGIKLPFVDVGWQGASVIVYSNQLGYLYLVLGLGFNLLLFALKWTDTFQPTDIWNYYQFVFWAIIVQFVTGNFWLGVASALFLNLVVLLLADIIAPALQEYYGYGNTTLTSVPVGGLVGAMIFKWIFDKMRFKDREVSVEDLNDKLGFWGEPVTIGLLVGFIIAFLGSISGLGDPKTWSAILTAMLVVAGVMVIYPTVSGLFVKGLVPLSQSMQKQIRSGKSKRKNFNIALDPAVYFGESRNLTAGLLLIPLVFFISLVMPGNRILMLADIAALPFMTVPFIVAFRGNIIKAVAAGTVWFSFSNILNSDVCAAFTDAAKSAGVADKIPAVADAFSQGLGVAAWTVGTNPALWLVYKAFAADGSWKWLTIGIAVAVYLAIWWHFRTHRYAWYRAAGASEEYLVEHKAAWAANELDSKPVLGGEQIHRAANSSNLDEAIITDNTSEPADSPDSPVRAADVTSTKENPGV